MLPDRVSNPGPLTYESGALQIALRGPALNTVNIPQNWINRKNVIVTLFFKVHKCYVSHIIVLQT